MSYHVYVVDLVKTNQVDKFESLLASGISTNPANTYGEGLINLVCRLGSATMLQTMVEAGCDIQVSDDYGRTPMHDACWARTPACKCKRGLG
jgi:ankyrin repeat protein